MQGSAWLSRVIIGMMFLFAVIGLALGSFGNVLLHRLETGESIGGRSHCPRCHATLRAWDLVPVLSYLWLGGKCRSCHARISVRYPLIEGASCIAFLMAAMLFSGDPLGAYLTGVCLVLLLLICVEDALHQHISDALTLLLALCGCAVAIYQSNVISGLIGACVGGAWFGAQILVSRGKAAGTGDLLLSMALGVWLGWQQTLTMLILAYITGALVALGLMIRGHAVRKRRIAFGPFLGAGTLLTLLGVGEWYLRLLQGGVGS